MEQDSHIIDDENEIGRFGLRRRHQQTEKWIKYRRNIIEEKRRKLYLYLQRESSAIDPLLYSFHNMKTLMKELYLFNSEFKALL